MTERAPSPHLRHIKDTVQNLVRYRGTTRLYGPGHRFAERFLVGFGDSVQLASPDESFDVELSPKGFFHHGELLARGEPARELALLLYEEGLRRIGFTRGTERAELFKLAKLLVYPWERREDADEDLISALWRADFRQVDLLAVERFQEVLGESGEAALREDLALGRKLGLERSRLIGDSVHVGDLDWDVLLKDTMEAARQFRMKQDEAALYLRFRRQLDFKTEEHMDAHQGLFDVPAKQKRALQAEVDQVIGDQDVDLDQAAWILFDLVRSAREGHGQGELGRLSARCAVELVEEARPQDAAALNRRLLSFAKDDFPGVLSSKAFQLGYGALLGEYGERLADAYSKLGEPAQSAPGLFTLLGLVHKNHVERIQGFMLLLKHLAHQVVVADVLRLRKQIDLNEQAEHLAQLSGPEAILPLLSLWREGAGRGQQQAWRLLKDEDPRTREASLRCLRGERSERLVDHLVESLVDDLPGPRIEALRHAAIIGSRKLLPLLEQGCKLEALRSLEADEMRAWCTAYAVAGRVGAQTELGHMLLEERTETTNDLFVRAACAQGLKASRAAQAGPSIDKALRHWPELSSLLDASDSTGRTA
ncbi:MAG: hypothetical protein ACI9VR_000309 [Cognaticolwellia sp.]|jgi:hypothetical protein